MDHVTRKKWDRAASGYDHFGSRGPERRWAPVKRDLFRRMGAGKILFLAVGTGLDIQFFPAGKNITGIDISPKMLELSRDRAASYDGRLELEVMDVHELSYDSGSFDQVFTSCTFCSVPDPVRGLESLRRVLKPGGQLHMFEHTGSRWFPFNVMLHAMTPISSKLGPDLNRTTVKNVHQAGFEVREVHNLYLDVVKTIHAVSPTGKRGPD